MSNLLNPFILLGAAVPVAALAFCVRTHLQVLRQMRSLQSAHEATMRLLRLAAGDQRNIALSLFGHAQKTPAANAALTGLARRLLTMSEDLIEQTDAPHMPRTLTEEELSILPVVEFAMAQVAANLGPSRRVWRIAPMLEHARLLADRRALNQVFVNVFSGAAAATRDGDWIEVSAEATPEAWVIDIQDEGIGLPVAQTDRDPTESRGIGLQLTLARSLMQAHGGSLTVESTERVGTRVRLGFPPTRLLAA